jgi:heme oxygenase
VRDNCILLLVSVKSVFKQWAMRNITKLRLLAVLAVAASPIRTSQAFAPSVSRKQTNCHKTPLTTSVSIKNQGVLGDDGQATIENPRLTGLSFLLDDGTRKSHSIAENTAFVSGFFKGLSTRDSYRTLVTSLYYVYNTMETAFDTVEDVSVQTLDDDELRRLASLERDMEYFYGLSWRDSLPSPSLATQAYVARIQQVAQNKPYNLIGHQYSRYLGDLFGGQMMKGMATRSLNLEDGQGVSFYEFDKIDDTKEFITDWYTRLNALDLTDAQKKEIVDEANYVFGLNIAIFEELEGSPFKAMWSLAWKSLKLKLGVAL